MANSIGGVGIFKSGSKAVATAGTAEALDSAGLIWASLTIIAKAANTGKIFVGGSDVASTTNSGLGAGDALEITPSRAHGIDLGDIYIDSSVNSEGVDFYVSL
jgi:hypothetical protein